MIKTFTLKTTIQDKAEIKKENSLPEFVEPDKQLILSLLNFSKSTVVKPSCLINELVSHNN